MGDGALALEPTDARQPLLRLRSDAGLTKLAAAGSTPAFAAIYQRHHQAIYRYCRSILGNEHDARDALQNSMIKALQALQGETREINLRPWLFRIAHNESISLLRRRPSDAGIDEAAELSAPEADPETRHRLRGLLDDLDQITERQRGALLMRELSGLEFSEIAAALETSPDGAKQAVYEARLALRDLEVGREMNCDQICATISTDDRRRLRGRSVRAHLKSCDDCRAFADQMRSRKGQLAAIAPLPAPAALGILESITGGGGGGVAALGGGGGALAGFGGAAALKLGAAAIVAVGVGGVAIEGSESSVRSATPSAISAPAAAPDDGHGTTANGVAANGVAAGDSASKANAGAETGGGGSAAANGGDGAGSSEAAPGQDATAPPAGAPPAAQQGSPGSPSAAPSGNGPTGTPPGQGGTPPGQGGTPPGLETAPPGLGGTPPGQGGTAPGLGGGTPPGLGGGTPPGLGGGVPGLGGGTPPGPGGTVPGLGGAPPGLGGSNPGQGGGS